MGIRNENAYWCCVSQLISIEGITSVEASTAAPLYVVGDSHSLSPAWRTVSLTESLDCCTTDWSLGLRHGICVLSPNSSQNITWSALSPKYQTIRRQSSFLEKSIAVRDFCWQSRNASTQTCRKVLRQQLKFIFDSCCRQSKARSWRFLCIQSTQSLTRQGTS